MPTPKSQPEGGTGLATKTKGKAKLQPPSMWKVILHNDDYTTQDFVVLVLTVIFRKPESEATRIMLAVHHQGKGVAGLFTHDVAETKITQARALAEQHEYPLLCTMEPESVEA
ncbi:MAG: ATP-dependent Clp protease adapter ClpS [Holophagaceae bacterium]|nr:ATP-dependent Clp protease adapter ClpS [Holophagaceae bacterium]